MEVTSFENTHISEIDNNRFVVIEGFSENEDVEPITIAKVWLTPNGDIVTDWHKEEYKGNPEVEKLIGNSRYTLRENKNPSYFFINNEKRQIREEVIMDWLNTYATEFSLKEKQRIVNEVKFRMECLHVTSTMNRGFRFEEAYTKACVEYIKEHSLQEIEKEVDDKEVFKYLDQG